MFSQQLRSKRRKSLWAGLIIIVFSLLFNRVFILISQEFGFSLFIIFLFIGIGLIAYGSKLKEKITCLEAEEQAAAKKQEIQDFLDNIQTMNIKPKRAILGVGEIGLLIDFVALSELQTKRVSQSRGLRIGKAYLGASQAETLEGWKAVASGELFLSNKRLIFTGDTRSLNVDLKKLGSVENVGNGIRIMYAQQRSKPVMLAVENPALWDIAIRIAVQNIK